MRFSSNLSLLLAVASAQVSAQSSTTSSAPASTATSGSGTTGKLGDAPVVIDNPVGLVYKAVLPESAFFKPAYPNGGNIKGEITATAEGKGEGVRFTIKLSNLPKIGAPLPYHLHVNAVPDNGNCTATGAHIDPYLRGETPPCDSSSPATCQVGDLSGKHGEIPTDQDTWETSYVDLYASTVAAYGDGFFGNRSIVIHYPNKTRITCANFEKVEGAANLPGGGDDDGDDCGCEEGKGGSSSSSSSGSGSSSTQSAASSSTSVTPPLSTGGSTGGGKTNATATITGGVSATTSRQVTPPTTTSSVVVAAASGLRAGLVSVAVVGVAVLFMF